MLLELKNINYIEDNKHILKDISLKIEEGKFVAITGPNGAGKSTLMKIVMGLVKQSSGQIIYNGDDMTNLSIDKRALKGISYSFQQPVKFKGITVKKMLELSSGEKIKKDKIEEVLNIVGLDVKEYLYRELDDTLSGGELKRIEIASILLKDSSLMIFDEPEAGIDLWGFSNLIGLFENIKKNTGKTVIIISHQEKILKYADEIVVLKKGELAGICSYDQLEKGELV